MSGLPGKTTIDDYGGKLADYLKARTDPTTDRPATGVNQGWADVAGMTRTAYRAEVEWVGLLGNPIATYHEAVWGNGSSIKPTCVRFALGVFDWTWPSSVIDALLVTQTVNFTNRARGCITAGTPGIVVASITGPNTIRVSLYTLAGAPSDLVGSSIFVEAK